MAAPCPRCGSEIRDSEVSVDDAPPTTGSDDDRAQRATCLCCGTQLTRRGTEAIWELRPEG